VSPIQRIADLPFRERDPLALLHIEDEERAAPEDFAGFGYARIPAIHLDDGGPRPPRLVRDALVLGLHSADDGPALADDVELEFWLDDGASVAALLSVFLADWLPRLRAGEAAIVLALCNPHRAALPRPAAAGATPLYYPTGDVESWLDIADDGARRLRLAADAWHLAE